MYLMLQIQMRSVTVLELVSGSTDCCSVQSFHDLFLLLGELCGACVPGTGFSALLNRCVSCSDGYSALIVVLVGVDVCIILLLLWVSKPMPLWFYPVLFYLQLLPHFTTHFPATFEMVRPYLVYVASTLGLYFPYDFCLYEDASAFVNYVFRYLPLFLAVVIIPLVVAIKKKRSPRDTWHGVWWLILLLYTPIVHTSVTILHCPSFPAQEVNSTLISTQPRWYVNGNIKCFSGAHIALSLLAIIVLLFSVFLVPLLLFVIFTERKQLSRRPRWFELAAVAFQDSFKYWWWCAMELFRRLVLVTLAVAFPRNDYPVIFALFIFTGVTGFIKPYGNKDSHKKKGYVWTVNILDIFLASNILVMLLLRNTESMEEAYEELPATQQVTANSGTRVTSAQCGVNGMTKFAIILTSLYYLPLVVGIIALVGWLCYLFVNTVKRYRKFKKKEAKTDDVMEENNMAIREERPRTQTVVDIRQYDPDAENQSEVPTASLSPIARKQSLPLSKFVYSFRKWSKRESRGSSRRWEKKQEEQMELKSVERKTLDEQHDTTVSKCDAKDQTVTGTTQKDNTKSLTPQSSFSSDNSVTEI